MNLTELNNNVNITLLSTQMVVIDAENELVLSKESYSDGSVVFKNEDGQVVNTKRFDELMTDKNGDHQRIYDGQFREVLVWKNETVKREWRWDRPMFFHNYLDKVTVLNMDESQNGIEGDDGDIWEVEMDAEVLYRRAIQIMQDQGFTFLAGKSHKLVFLNPGVQPEEVLGKVWTNFVDKNKGSDSQFIAGMLLRPGLPTTVSKNIVLPSMKATKEMDGCAIVFGETQWKHILNAFGLSPETCAMQITYSNPITGDAFKGTIAIETQGRPAGTYIEGWKYHKAKSINTKFLSVMNSDVIINSRASWNNQMSYYELNNVQRHRLVKDYQLALDNISDLKSLAGAGHVITAGHLIAEGMNPFYGSSAEEINTIRRNMALKACRNTPIPGWMLLVMPSLDLNHDEIRVPKRVYRQFKKAQKSGIKDAMKKALMQRHPTLPTGGSLQHYKVVGISKGNIIEIGMRSKDGVTQWGSRQLGDFDGDQGVLADPFWSHERLHDFVPKTINNQEKYKPVKKQTECTDVQTRIEMMVKEVTISIGAGDSAARQAIDNDMATPAFLEQCAMAVQSAITSKKYETDSVELIKPKGMLPVDSCAFQQLKLLKKSQDVDAFASHWMMPAVVQALDIADMENQGLEYSSGKVKDAFVQVSLMFSKGAVAEAMQMANNMVNQFRLVNELLKSTQDAKQRQLLNRKMKMIRQIEIPLMVETQGIFALWEPKGFVGNLFTEQDMRRALISLAIAQCIPNDLRVWALSMDRAILELFLFGRGGDEFVLLTGGTPNIRMKDENGNPTKFMQIEVREGGLAFQHNIRIGRFAVDKTVPENGTYLFKIEGGTDRRMILSQDAHLA